MPKQSHIISTSYKQNGQKKQKTKKESPVHIEFTNRASQELLHLNNSLIKTSLHLHTFRVAQTAYAYMAILHMLTAYLLLHEPKVFD